MYAQKPSVCLMLNQIKSMQKLPNSVQNLFRFSLLCFHVLFNKDSDVSLFRIVNGQCDICGFVLSSTVCVYVSGFLFSFFFFVTSIFCSMLVNRTLIQFYMSLHRFSFHPHFVGMPMNEILFCANVTYRFDLSMCQSFKFESLQLCFVHHAFQTTSFNLCGNRQWIWTWTWTWTLNIFNIFNIYIFE